MSMFKNEQHFWNAVFFLGFVPVFFVCAWVLWLIYGEFPRSIPVFDLVLLSLATYRLIRLFCYDKITLFIRDYFASFERGPGKTVAHLLDCPWCIGVWFAMALTFIYYAFTIGWLFLLVVAVAGVASFIQILVNMIGWYAEGKKLEVKMMEMKTEMPKTEPKKRISTPKVSPSTPSVPPAV